MKKLALIILAAGKSKRMKSSTPKILHSLMGKPMIDYILDASKEAGVKDITVVVGHKKEQIINYLKDKVKFAEQTEQLGTGHAVLQAMENFKDYKGDILILCGDMPLLSEKTLKEFIKIHQSKNSKVSLLTGITEYPGKLGRIIRNELELVESITEAADATKEQLKIKEVNTGTYIFDADYLREILPKIGKDNAQGEIYLTDTISISYKNNIPVAAMICPSFQETLGVNNRADLAFATKVIKNKINYKLMLNGVTLYDPENTYIEETVKIEKDTTILPGCMITGDTYIASGCIIGPNTRIESSILENEVQVKESVIIKSKLSPKVSVGPYAHIRPESNIGKDAKIGNFVETKKSNIGEGTKVSHLSYIGDAQIGSKVNIGAGTITCNYDGIKKNKTIIKDQVFIGSNSSLVAPVTIEKNAATGAGSVVTKDVPSHTLVVGNPAKKLRDID